MCTWCTIFSKPWQAQRVGRGFRLLVRWEGADPSGQPWADSWEPRGNLRHAAKDPQVKAKIEQLIASLEGHAAPCKGHAEAMHEAVHEALHEAAQNAGQEAAQEPWQEAVQDALVQEAAPEAAQEAAQEAGQEGGTREGSSSPDGNNSGEGSSSPGSPRTPAAKRQRIVRTADSGAHDSQASDIWSDDGANE